ncbi:MAG: 50S ribosomal protein L4 [Candidatus Nasuia deltocephalinicola]
MRFNYIDSLGKIKFFLINGLFFRFFFNLNFIYQFIVHYINYYRFCLSSQKSRSFVNYSTKKLYNQKGTGRSRAGSFSSNLRVGGARSFPNIFFESHFNYFNKTSYRFCYFFIYSNLFLNNCFFFLEDLFFLEYKTKLFFYFFNNFIFGKSIFLTLKIERNFFLSISNLKNFYISYFFNFNPMMLIKFHNIIITRSCFHYFDD